MSDTRARALQRPTAVDFAAIVAVPGLIPMDAPIAQPFSERRQDPPIKWIRRLESAGTAVDRACWLNR